MAIVKMLKEAKYLALAIGLSFLMFFLYPFLQVLPQGGLNNFWFWFSLLTPLAWFLYLLYGILFGITLSFFLWQRSKKVCLPAKKSRGGFFGLVGSFLGTSAPLCPSCLSWVALILPFSVGLSLLKYNIEIMVFSIILLFLALWLRGGFQGSQI